ncbi:MAG TPA: hypothetical protein VGT03_11585 [Candidatus Acidoferrales bacterium]|nr:hypothetical protein [Candidatus Acidoferrales bacterium]
MKLGAKAAGILFGLLILPVGLRAQQQSTPAEKPAMTHLRVELVLAEYSGEKKISSLPYTVYVAAGDDNDLFSRRYWQSVRMGVRVPIALGPQASSGVTASTTQFSYQDLGTDIDCGAAAEADGRYRIEAKIDRSSIYAPDEGESGGDRPQMNVVPHQPVIRHFNSGFDLRLRDGETGEGISATDPFNGHVLKVSVTIHVVK